MSSSGQPVDKVVERFGYQIGDPMKAARAIVGAVNDGCPTLRLPLGADAVQNIRGKLAQVASDIDKSEAVATATAFSE